MLPAAIFDGNIRDYDPIMSGKNLIGGKLNPLLAAAAALASAVVLFPVALIPELLAPLKYYFPHPDLFLMMPGAAIGGALSGTAAVPVLRAAIAWLCFDSARRSGGWRAGLAAAALSLFFVSDGEQLLFSFFLLLLLDLSLSRRGKEDTAGAAAAGVVLGAAFLMRSPAAPLALACAAAELLLGGGAPRARAGRAAVMVSIPLLSLAAWVWLSDLVLGSPVLFEAGRSGYNLVSGALGAVGTIQGDYYALAGVPPGANLFLWAAGHIASDPLPYLKGIAGRAAYFFTTHPVLTLAAAAGGILAPQKKGSALAALFTSVFLVSLFLFSVEKRYFTPALFMMAVLAGGLAGWRRLPGKDGGAHDAILAGLAGASFLWVVYINAAVAGAAARLRPLSEAAEAELREGKAGPLLLELAAGEAFSDRDTDKGEELLRKAAGRGAAGAAKMLEIIRGSGRAPLVSESEMENLLAPMVFRALELGNEEEAAARLKELETWKRNVRSSDPEIYARLRAAASLRPLEPDLLSALRYWPEESHRSLLSRLSRLLPLRGDLALKFLFSPGGGAKKESASFWKSGDGGAPRAARDAFISVLLAARRGGTAAAEAAARPDSGLFLASEDGRRLLLRAGLIAGSESMTAQALGRESASAAKGEKREFLCGGLRELRNAEQRESVFSETAWRQAKLGLRKEAKASVECGLGSGLSENETLLLAVALQDAGDPALASEIMDRLAAGDPDNPLYPGYSGVARMLAGDRAGAVKRFRSALTIDPSNRTAAAGLAAAGGTGSGSR